MVSGKPGVQPRPAPVLARLLDAIQTAGTVSDVRVGTHWTAVVVETPLGPKAGLASTQLAHDLTHTRPAVADAGKLIGREARALAGLALSESPTERTIGLATINALLEVDEAARCVERNAEDLILERGRGRKVAIIGHFPFVPRVREVAAECWVLELNPAPGDLDASRAPEVIPQADVVAITGMTLVNGTFEQVAGLAPPAAFALLLGATTPLAPLLFEYGIGAISGTILVDIPIALVAVSQGANFRQIPGKRLVTMLATEKEMAHA